MNQPIYKIIDKKFEDFVTNNLKAFENLPYDKIINITNKNKITHFSFSSSDLTKKPFSIQFIGKTHSHETVMYNFLNKDMDKIYIYCSNNANKFLN